MFSGFQDDWSQALSQENAAQIEELISLHADDKNSEGQTALMLAAQQSLSNLALLLLPYSLHVYDPKGRTALHYAVIVKNTAFLKLFLAKTWLKRDENGMSPIETAIVHDAIEPLKFFLQHRMLLQDDLEAARILASECKLKHIVELLMNYDPFPLPLTLDSQKIEDKVYARLDSADLKALISKVRNAITNHSDDVDELIYKLLEKATGTPSLGKVLTLCYSKRVKDLKACISTNEQTIRRLTEDSSARIATLNTLANEVQRLTLELEGRDRIKTEVIDFSALTAPLHTNMSIMTDSIIANKTIEAGVNSNLVLTVDTDDKGTQCISLQCDECLRQKILLNNYNNNIEDLKEQVRFAKTELDEYIVQLQKITKERDEALDKLNAMIAETVKPKIDVAIDTRDEEKTVVDEYVMNLIKEIQHTMTTLQNGSTENPNIASKVTESTLKTADELIRMVTTLSTTTTTNPCYTQSITESLFSNLTIFLVELLKEKHIAKAAILEKIYLENAIQELHLTAHLDSKTILSKAGKSITAPNASEFPSIKESQTIVPTIPLSKEEPVMITEPNLHVSKFDNEDLDLLDDAETLGKSLSTKDLDTIVSPSQYTASFIKSAIREASSMSSFTSEKLAGLPQKIDNRGQDTLSDISNTSTSTLSSISFVSHDSRNSISSAPGGIRHVLTYGDKRTNTEMIINQMIKLGTEKPIVSGKPLPLSAHDSSNMEPALSQPVESNVNILHSETMKGCFGKRNAELCRVTNYLMKSSYQPPVISDGRSPFKNAIADISNSWIRSSSPLNKYNADMMKKSNPYDVYRTLLSKSRSISTPLAKSHGPDIAD